jgi:hypothetical protein
MSLPSPVNWPLSQVRDLLAHASIVTTERYDNLTQDALLAAANRLETGAVFKSSSRQRRQECGGERRFGWVTGFEPATSGATVEGRP